MSLWNMQVSGLFTARRFHNINRHFRRTRAMGATNTLVCPAADGKPAGGYGVTRSAVVIWRVMDKTILSTNDCVNRNVTIVQVGLPSTFA